MRVLHLSTRISQTSPKQNPHRPRKLKLTRPRPSWTKKAHSVAQEKTPPQSADSINKLLIRPKQLRTSMRRRLPTTIKMPTAHDARSVWSGRTRPSKGWKLHPEVFLLLAATSEPLPRRGWRVSNLLRWETFLGSQSWDMLTLACSANGQKRRRGEDARGPHRSTVGNFQTISGTFPKG